MKIKEYFHYLIGYIIGGALFGFLIPYGLYKLAESTNYIYQINIFGNIIIRVLAWLLLFIGIIFAIWSNIYLFSIGKGGPAEAFGVEISPKTKRLVIKGPYKYSRNPMVFGAFCCYLATAVLFKSIIGVGALVIGYFIMILFIKLSEEKRLVRDFGEEYIQYKQRVSMIIPWRKKY